MMNYKCMLFIVILIELISMIYGQRGQTSSGCKMTLPTDMPENEPVYLLKQNDNYSIFTPTGRENKFKINSKIIMFCPGKNNMLSIGGHNTTEVTCNSNSKLTIGTRTVTFNTLNCTKENVGNIKITQRKCSNNKGSINQIGYQLTPIKFIQLFEVCFNNNSASVIYTKHTINGKAIRYNIKESERREFKATGITQARPTISYKKSSQLTHFNNILGGQQTYFNSTSFLSRGHLTADADFVFSTEQFATYFYINVAPQFQNINAGNWLKVEIMARNLSMEYNTELNIYTGVYDQLTLRDENNDEVPLWLEANEKIEVPKWLYKVIHNQELDSAIVMITLNNPFAKRRDIVEFCPNICTEAGLQASYFNNIWKGYTFCCELDTFKNVVNDLPQSLTATNLLGCSSLRF